MTISNQVFVDSVSTTAAAAIGPTDTTITVVDASKFPTLSAGQYFEVTLASGTAVEVINITGKSGNTLTGCVRGQSGHPAQSFAAGSLVEGRISAQTLSSFARLVDRMDVLPSVVALQNSKTVNSNSYVCANSDVNGGSIVALNNLDGTWSFPSHSLISIAGTISSISNGTLQSAAITNQITTLVPNQYLIQMTSGAAIGQVRPVTSTGAGSITFSPPFTPVSGNVAVGDSFRVLQSSSSVMQNFVNTNSGQTDLSGKVNKAGATMTGELILAGFPTNPLDAVPLAYVTQQFQTYGALVRTPTEISPIGANVSINPTLTGSIYYSLYGVSQGCAQFQVATDTAFGNVIRDSGSIAGSISTWVVNPVLSSNSSYVWRVRYQDSEGKWSQWSSGAVITTGSLSISTPSISSPVQGATGLNPTFTLSASLFATTGGTDTQASARWQITTDSSFSTIALDTGDVSTSSNTYTIPAGSALNYGTTYYARMRYTGVLAGLSAWSSAISFSTLTGSINTPSVSSASALTTVSGTPSNPVMTINAISSTISTTGPSDTIASSDWEVRTATAGNGTLVASYYNDATRLYSAQFTVTNFTGNTTYYVRTRQKGATLGTSSWSTDYGVTSPAPIANTPVAGTASAVSTTGATLSATALSNPSFPGDTIVSTDWLVYRASDNSLVVNDVNDSTNLTSYNATGLSPATAYNYKTRFKSTFGYTSYSNVSSFTTLANSGEKVFTGVGTYKWTPPPGVTRFSFVAIGGGASGMAFHGVGAANTNTGAGCAGSGGGCIWMNNIDMNTNAASPDYLTIVISAGATGTGPSSGYSGGQGVLISVTNDGADHSGKFYGCSWSATGGKIPTSWDGSTVTSIIPTINTLYGIGQFDWSGNGIQPDKNDPVYNWNIGYGGLGGYNAGYNLGPGYLGLPGGGGGAGGYYSNYDSSTFRYVSGGDGGSYPQGTIIPAPVAGKAGTGAGGGGACGAAWDAGGAAGGGGGGGTSLYGSATTSTNGGAGTTNGQPGVDGGNSGAGNSSGFPNTATIGYSPGSVTASSANYAGGNGGGYGGGGGQTMISTAGLGGPAGVRIIWGPNRTFPTNAA